MSRWIVVARLMAGHAKAGLVGRLLLAGAVGGAAALLTAALLGVSAGTGGGDVGRATARDGEVDTGTARHDPGSVRHDDCTPSEKATGPMHPATAGLTGPS